MLWTLEMLRWGDSGAEDDAGEGITSGLRPRSARVPLRPTKVERRKPGLERSMMYQRTGLTRASVRETCRVDVQGSLR